MNTTQFISPLRFPENNQWNLALHDIIIPSLFHISLPESADSQKEFKQMLIGIMESVKLTNQTETDNCSNWLITIYNGIHHFLDVEKSGKDYSNDVTILSNHVINSIYQQKKKAGVMTLLNQITHLLAMIDKKNHEELIKYPIELEQVKNAAELLNTLQVVTDHITEKLNEKGAKSTAYLEQIANVFSRMLFIVSLVDYFKRAKKLRKSKQISSTRKVGRNEPCPCGSGKKYKKCCGAPT